MVADPSHSRSGLFVSSSRAGPPIEDLVTAEVLADIQNAAVLLAEAGHRERAGRLEIWAHRLAEAAGCSIPPPERAPGRSELWIG